MKIDRIERLFLIFNGFIAGSGTAAGFAFPSIAFLAALFGITGSALIVLSIEGIAAFGIIGIGVGCYFFYRVSRDTKNLINQIEVKQEKMLETLISYALIKKNVRASNNIPINVPEEGVGEEKILFKEIRKIIYRTLRSDDLSNNSIEKIKDKLKQNTQFVEHFERYKQLVFSSHSPKRPRKTNKREDNLIEEAEFFLMCLVSLVSAIFLIIGSLPAVLSVMVVGLIIAVGIIAIGKYDLFSQDNFFSPELHGSVSLFIIYGSILGPFAGLIGAITGMGFLGGLSTLALPVLVMMVGVTLLITAVTVYLVHYSETCNMQRNSIINAAEKWIDSINGAERKLLLDNYFGMRAPPSNFLTDESTLTYSPFFQEEASLDSDTDSGDSPSPFSFSASPTLSVRADK